MYISTYSENIISVILHSIQCNDNNDLNFAIFLVLYVYSREESQPMNI